MNIDFSQVINMKLAVILWLTGFGIKHINWKPVKQLSNKLIPVLLTILGIGLSCVFIGDVNFDGILTGIVTSMFAVGVHSSGHNAWKAFIDMSSGGMDITGNNLSGSSGGSYSPQSGMCSNTTTDDGFYDHSYNGDNNAVG